MADFGEGRVTYLKAIISPQVNQKEDKLDATQDAPKEHSRRGYVAHITNEWWRLEEIKRWFEVSEVSERRS